MGQASNTIYATAFQASISPVSECVHAFVSVPVCVCISVCARVFSKDRDLTSEQACSTQHCVEAESLSPQAARLHAVLQEFK